MKLIKQISSTLIFFLFSLFLSLPSLHFLLENEHREASISSYSVSPETIDCYQFVYFHELNTSCTHHDHLIEKKSHCLLCAFLLNFKSTVVSRKSVDHHLDFNTEKEIASSSFEYISFYIFNKESRGPPSI